MTKIIHHIICLLLFACGIFSAKASHIIGGTIYYDYLGGSSYRIFVSVYRDCNSAGANFDSPLTLGIFRKDNNFRVGTYNLSLGAITMVPVVFQNPCVIPPNDICVQSTTYQLQLELPPTPGGYVISYTRCCRGPEINNLINPEDQGLTLEARIPGIEGNAYQNSSPRFQGYPPLLLCNNEDLVFNHTAEDPDGDQIVYSLAAPFQGGTSYDPAPNPPPSPPYVPVQWAGGYTTTTPLGPGSSITINPQTGVLTASPNLAGRYVVGIRVSEYRNGVLISSVVRDFIFKVFNCQITMQAILPLQESLPGFQGFCSGNTQVNFINNSYGGTNYQWDFDDPQSGANNSSSLFTPSHNYSDTGHYRVRLVVNPGWPCTDTAFMDIHVYDEFTASINQPDAQCVTGNSFVLIGTSDGPAHTTYNWNFGNNALVPTAVGSNTNVSFNTIGNHVVTLTARHGVCQDVQTVTLQTTPSPIASVGISPNYRCEGLDVVLSNNSTNSDITTWRFGDGATSNELNITHTYNQPGTYRLDLVVASNNGCSDSVSMDLVVNTEIELGLPTAEDQCITYNVFDFVGQATGPVGANYWMTLSNLGGQQFTGTSILDYSFDETGYHQVTLHGQFQECSADTTITVRIIGTPVPDFKLEPGLRCVPFNAQFVNLTVSETPVEYLWDFGNGDFSSIQHPSAIYSDSGIYTVTLTVWSHEGCLDTFILVKEDLLQVHPKPEAKFTVDREVVDVCNSAIQITNLTTGDLIFQYDFDDQTARNNDFAPLYFFRNEGMHTVSQFVRSVDGCLDTATVQVYVEPFTIYAPNTFTPDGDEHNNLFKVVVQYPAEEWHLTIYNRWGERLFEAFDQNAVWDGTYNGEMVQDGTYLYTIEYQSCSPILTERKRLSGYVTVIR